MKKALSFLLALAMILVMIPAGVATVSAEDTATATTPTTTWTDAGNYDISWCKTLDTADDTKTVTVGDKYYYVKGDWTKQVYHITTPQQLAGLAYLSNITSGDLFKGDTFQIEADLDLSAHLWIPISKSSKFRGSIIGAKGGTVGKVATITGMTIDTSSTGDVSVGLIGKFGGDWLKDLKLVNAKIKAHSFTVGGFVGWQDGNVGSGIGGGQGGYMNLLTDAEIVLTTGRSDRFDDVGGIVGIINNCNTNNKPTIINNCVFTGTISAPWADNLGGIVGLSQYDNAPGPVISDCVVISEKLEYGFNNIGFSQDWNAGFGGIAGNLYSNTAGDMAVSNLSNCYVAAKMIVMDCEEEALSVQCVGGIVGASCSQTKNYENCQFDGVIVGSAKRIGGVLGRSMATITVKNTVITGLVFAQDGAESSFYGRGTDANTIIESSFGAIEMVEGKGSVTVVPQITKDTDFTSLLAVKDANGNAVWTKNENSLYPILAIAKNYLNDSNKHLSVAMSGVDFSSIKTLSGTIIDTKEKLDTALTVAEIVTKSEAQENLVSKLIITLDVNTELLLQYNEANQRLIKIAMGLDPDAQDDRICIAFAQVAVTANSNPEKPNLDGTYNIRIVAKMTDTNIDGVKFTYTVKNGDDTKDGTSSNVTTCYKELNKVVDGVNTVIKAEDGSYYVVCVLKNVSIDETNGTAITVKAMATLKDSEETVKSSTVTFTLAKPATDTTVTTGEN